MKKYIFIVCGIILVTLLGKFGWAYYQVQVDNPRTENSVTTPSPIVLSALDIKAKEDLNNTISGLTESIKLKCGISSKDTQCDTAKKVVSALTTECSPLVNEKEISDCIFSYSVGTIFSSAGTTNTSDKTGTTVELASSLSQNSPGVYPLDVKVGEKFYISWKSTNANRALLDVSIVRCPNVSSETKFPTKTFSAEDYFSDTALPSWDGCSISVNITVKNDATGEQASDYTVVGVKPGVIANSPAPTAVYTVDGVTNLSVENGSTKNFVWSSTNADSFSVTETLTGCLYPVQNRTETYALTTSNGSRYDAMYSMEGCTVSKTFTAKNSKTGKQATATITIKVD